MALLAGILTLAAGWGGGLEQALRSMRDQVRTHVASGQIAIIEIDARSLAALDQWPWPRRYHAGLIDRLAAANVSLIALDVTFAVQSNPVDDEALAAALERANGLVALPTFQQREAAGSSITIEALPYNMFRENAFLAGVNVVSDRDGLVRRLPLGTMTAGTPRPSMASLLAESEGDIDELLEIDFAIDPNTIPRFSFIDVLEGRFDPAALAGKRVIVGGTAADMEDRYAVPLHGVLPGVVVQALGAETIIHGGVPGTGNGLWPILLAFLVSLWASRPGNPGWRSALLAGGFAIVLVLPLASEQWFALTVPIVPALGLLSMVAAGALALHIGDRFRVRATVDAETGLPNLRALIEARTGHDAGMVAVAHLDRFAALAAGLGPERAVTLVQRVADRLRGDDERAVYRIDDHKLAWLEPTQDRERVAERFAAINRVMRSPIECGRLVDVTLGLGAASSCVDHDGRVDSKQQVANAALAAERALRNKLSHAIFSDGDAEGAETGWHLSLIGELDAAIAAGEVWNAYQPKLDVATGQIIGVETLVRWRHRERGAVGPDEFIPVIEAAGRAADLTAHVFRHALADASQWRARGHDLSVAVNVSATLLEDRAFIDWLRETLAVSAFDPSHVTIEVTESAAVKDVDQAAAALAEWRALGVGISIDDYGTGQSSLGYLQRLPAGELKIDKSFVQTIVCDARDAIMVRSTIALAHQLGMKVVAEGVEDEATLRLLREFGCDVAQGWLIGRPVASDELLAGLNATAALAA